MNFLLDLLLLAILAVTVIRYTSRGFVKSVIGAISLVVAFVAAFIFTPELSLWLETNVFAGRVTENVSETICGLAAKGGEIFDLSRLFEDMPADFAALLERYGADTEALAASFGSMDAVAADAAERMARSIAGPVVAGLANVSAFILIFLASLLVLWLLGLLLGLIVKLPVLRTADKFLGFLLGTVCAALLGLFFSTAAEQLLGYLHTVDPSLFDADVIGQTLLVKYFCNFHLFT